MVRVKRGIVARKRRKKVFSLTKGAIGSNTYLFRMAQQHAIKSIRYAYRGRHERRRQGRSISLVRLNARVRIYGLNYSSFIHLLRQKKYFLNRKMLVQLAIYDIVAFQTLLDLFFMFNFSVKIFFCGALLSRRNTYPKKESLPSTLLYSIEYKNVNLLRRYIGITGKILPRRITKLTAKEHRSIAKAIRQARRVGLLPFVWLTN
jgi:large subunit ribosomal protein L20